jgi:hypothetical protein
VGEKRTAKAWAIKQPCKQVLTDLIRTHIELHESSDAWRVLVGRRFRSDKVALLPQVDTVYRQWIVMGGNASGLKTVDKLFLAE